MKRIAYLAGIFLALNAQVLESTAVADVLFESGTLGPTGVSWSDVFSQVVPGTNINASVFTGVRFELNQPARVTQVGGHFVAPNSGTFFGAISTLDSGDDFPDSDNLSTPDVVATTTLTFPTLSADVYANLDKRLDPGWYALVFGSGLFGTSGAGGALRNNTDIGTPTYIAHQPVTGWFNLPDLSPIFINHRFVVLGTTVPEPSGLFLLLLAVLSALLLSR